MRYEEDRERKRGSLLVYSFEEMEYSCYQTSFEGVAFHSLILVEPSIFLCGPIERLRKG